METYVRVAIITYLIFGRHASSVAFAMAPKFEVLSEMVQIAER